jgi:hypothetical protein
MTTVACPCERLAVMSSRYWFMNCWKAGVALGHQEVRVVSDTDSARDLVLGALGFSKMGERKTNIRQENNIRHD